jgi:hypothetical protein
VSFIVLDTDRVAVLLLHYVKAYRAEHASIHMFDISEHFIKTYRSKRILELNQKAEKLPLSPAHVFYKWLSFRFAIMYLFLFSSMTDLKALLQATATLQITLCHLIT